MVLLLTALLVGLFTWVGAATGKSAVAPATPDAHRAALQIVSLSPVRIRGRNFRAGEHVRVTLRASGKSARRTVTSSGGGFVARFSIAVDPCAAGMSVSAVGDRGSRAVAKRLPRACAPSASAGRSP